MDAWKKATIKASEQGASAVMSKSGLSLLEARKILGVGKKVDVKDLNMRYKKLFEANATDKSGSFYLQSKVVRAKERLEEALKNKEIET